MTAQELIWALGAHVGRTPVQIGLPKGQIAEIASVVVVSGPNPASKAVVLVLEPPDRPDFVFEDATRGQYGYGFHLGPSKEPE